MAYSRDLPKMATWLSWTIMDYHGLSWTIVDYNGLLWTIIDYYWLSWTVMDCYGLSWTGFSIYWSVSNIFSYGQTFSMNQSILIGQTVSQGQIIISSSQTAMAKSRDPSDDLKRIQWEIKKERRFCCWQFYECKCYIFCLNMFFTRGNDWYIHNLLWFLIKWRI